MAAKQHRNTRVTVHMLLVDSKDSENVAGSPVVGEFVINKTGAGNSRHRIPLEREASRCKLETVVITITAAAGTAPTAVDIEILDTNTGSPSLDGVNTIYRNTGVAISGGTPEKLVNQLIEERGFVTKGTAGELQLSLTFTGGDGTTDYNFNIQLYGDVMA